jgi:hypothetical protein
MSEPIVITISHRLGRDAARRRIEDGLAHIRGQLALFVSAVTYEWSEDRLDFSVVASGQTVNGRIDIEETAVRVELGLPFLLRVLSAGIVGRIRSRGTLLLNGPWKP